MEILKSVVIVLISIALIVLSWGFYQAEKEQKRCWKNQWSSNLVFTAAINDIHTGIGRTDYLSLETTRGRKITKEDLCFDKDGSRTGELLQK